MNITECIERMHRYYRNFGDQSGHRVLVVNVENIDDLNEIRSEFWETSVDVVNLSSQCEEDRLPQRETVIKLLKSQSRPMLLTELTTFWKFYGQEELVIILSEIMQMSVNQALVILAFQCRDNLNAMIRRDERRREQVCFVDGRRTRLPQLVMIQSNCCLDMTTATEKTVCGIQNVARELENWTVPFSSEPDEPEEPGTLTIFTRYRPDIFKNATYVMEWLSDEMDFIRKLDPAAMSLEKPLGTQAQWQWLLGIMGQLKNIRSCVQSILECQIEDLVSGLSRYYRWNENERWLYYIALRLWRPNNNPYLCHLIDTCSRSDALIRDIYRKMAEDTSIKERLINDEQYDEDIFWQKFWKIYQNRRKCLEMIAGNISRETMDFCQWIKLKKEKNAIYYLTDLTEPEIQTIFELLNMRSNTVNRDLNIGVLNRVYPKVVQYLNSCAFNADGVDHKTLLDIQKYFDLYKYCKVVNQFAPELEELSRKEAVERTFNKFPKRDASIEKICSRAEHGEKIEVWFIDAMGAEFLNYVLEGCKLRRFETRSWLHRANIPTETEQNYTFELRNKLFQANIRIIDEKTIDEGKHVRDKDYQYLSSTLPIHLCSELNCLDKALNRIENELRYNGIHTVYIIPDHGASRFAVLASESEDIVDTETKSFSSGRYCEWRDGMERIDDAIRSDDEMFYVMSGYRRFKGGRKAAVEVHGGASLEEVLVPMIKISLPGCEVEIFMDEAEIKVDYKTCAVLKLKSMMKLSDVHIELQDGKTFDAVSQDGNHFEVKTDIIKAGAWTFDVFEKSRRIAKDIHFKTISRGIQSNTDEDDFF